MQPCNVGADEVGTGEKSYGNYYTWKEAQEVCPTGYHLPSKEEWQDLLDDYLISK
ncbi:MAG: hypothetical protein LBD11_06335 [Candidatus Peribacteria bacterium]|nr:hypothetical protein [Candidatus Peribacteria bacterium]